MIEAFFLIAALSWWWVIAFSVITIACVWLAFDENVLSVALLSVFGLMTYYLVPAAVAHITLMDTIIFGGIYLTFGSIWSLFKWYKFIKADKSKFKARYYDTESAKYDVPEASSYVDRISTWIIFWPLSFIKYCIGDLFMDAIHFIIKRLGGVYRKIGEYAARD